MKEYDKIFNNDTLAVVLFTYDEIPSFISYIEWENQGGE